MKLEQGAQAVVKTRLDWLANARKALDMIALLPQEIQDIDADGVGADTHGSGLDINFNFYNEGTVPKAKEAMKTLMRAGIVFQVKPIVSLDDKRVSYRASRQKIGDIELTVYISGLPKPPNCIVKEVPNTGTHLEIVCAMEQSA